MADTPLDETNEVIIRAGSTSNNELEVNADGSVNSRLYDSAGSGVLKGQTTMANSVPVTFASDQPALSVSIVPTTVPGTSFVRLYTRVVVNSHPTTLVTYTVPVGKVVDVELWHLNTNNAITLVELQVAGVAQDAIRFSNSTNTERLEATFGVNTPLEATAGQVVRLRTISGDTGKEFIAGINAVQRDA